MLLTSTPNCPHPGTSVCVCVCTPPFQILTCSLSHACVIVVRSPETKKREAVEIVSHLDLPARLSETEMPTEMSETEIGIADTEDLVLTTLLVIVVMNEEIETEIVIVETVVDKISKYTHVIWDN